MQIELISKITNEKKDWALISPEISYQQAIAMSIKTVLK